MNAMTGWWGMLTRICRHGRAPQLDKHAHKAVETERLLSSRISAMSHSDFRPVVYLKDTCPWCLKFRLFVLEAGLREHFEFREFVPGDDREAAIREELAPHFAKPSFPTVQIAPGVYMRESDDLIAHYADAYGVDAAALPTLDQYIRGPLVRIAQLRAEIASLGG